MKERSLREVSGKVQHPQISLVGAQVKLLHSNF